MGVGGYEWIWALVSFIPIAVWLATFADIMHWPRERWDAVRRSRAAWILAVLFLQFFGTIAYWAVARPSLSRGALPDPSRDMSRILAIFLIPFVTVVLIWLVRLYSL